MPPPSRVAQRGTPQRVRTNLPKGRHGSKPSTLCTGGADDDRDPCTAIYNLRTHPGRSRISGKDGVAMKEPESEHESDGWSDWFNDQCGDAQIPFGD